MIGALKWLGARPSDKQIRLASSIFGGILVCTVYYNLFFLNKATETNFFWVELGENVLYIKIFTLLLGIIPLIVGITGFSLLKSKYMRIFQIFTGIFLMYLSGKALESATVEYDIILMLLGLFAFIVGILGKGITKAGLRYGEKIQKIRV